MSRKKQRDDPNQLTFFPQLARKIVAQSEITEPRLWFRELRLLTTLSPDGEKIRSFTFRPGLNVLWAEPENPDGDLETTGLYADGVGGHATGKTLFCRILRYILGDKNFCTDDDLEAIQGEFIELWAVAELRLDERTWSVGRALTGPGKDFALADNTIEQGLHSDFRPSYMVFLEALEKSLPPVLAALHPNEAWRHFLPWISRDQESRFSAINAWRNPLSQADNPQTTAEAQHLLMRATLNLLNPRESELRKALESLRAQHKSAEDKLPERERTHRRDLQTLTETLGEVPSFSIDLDDLESSKRTIKNHIEVREEAIAKLRSAPESARTLTARQARDTAQQKLDEAQNRIRRLQETEIPDLEKRRDEELAFIERVKQKGIRDPSRISDNFCPNSLLKAQERKCVHLPKDERSQLEIADLERRAEDFAVSLETKQNDLRSLEGSLDGLRKALEEASHHYLAFQREDYASAIQLERVVILLQSGLRQLENAIQSKQDANEQRQTLLSSGAEIERTRASIQDARVKVDDELKYFSQIYSDAIAAILGGAVSAEVALSERGLQLSAKRNAKLGGTAMATVKTIAFDFAAIIHSIEGRSHHPRFLIHDGPREGDMARIVYQRLFLYARLIEQSFPEDKAPFQYILTTTTPPPPNMREGSKWLLCPPLNGREKKQKLLREDF